MKPIIKYMWATPLTNGQWYRSVIERDTAEEAMEVRPTAEDCEQLRATGEPILIRATTTLEEVATP